MASVSWIDILDKHPIFKYLNVDEKNTIISSPLSRERLFEKGSVILRQGELGNSIYIIGRGSVSVLLGSQDKEIAQEKLSEGDIFGEMALFDHRPRSATLKADNDCVLLEIDGDFFLDLVKTHHEIAVSLLGTLSERIRNIDKKLITTQLSNLDQSVSLLQNRLDLVSSTTDSKLVATQALIDETKALYEHTNSRSNEIIDSADRARNRLNWLFGVFATLLTLGSGIAGAIGYFTLRDVLNSVNENKELAISASNEATMAASTASGAARDAVKAAGSATQLSQQTQEALSTAKNAASDANKALEAINRTEGEVENTVNQIDDHRYKFMFTDFKARFSEMADMENAIADDRTISLFFGLYECYRYPDTWRRLNDFLHDTILRSGTPKNVSDQDEKLLEALHLKRLKIKGFFSEAIQKAALFESTAVIYAYYYTILAHLIDEDAKANRYKNDLLEYIGKNRDDVEGIFKLPNQGQSPVIMAAIRSYTDDKRSQEIYSELSNVLSSLQN